MKMGKDGMSPKAKFLQDMPMPGPKNPDGQPEGMEIELNLGGEGMEGEGETSPEMIDDMTSTPTNAPDLTALSDEELQAELDRRKMASAGGKKPMGAGSFPSPDSVLPPQEVTGMA